VGSEEGVQKIKESKRGKGRQQDARQKKKACSSGGTLGGAEKDVRSQGEIDRENGKNWKSKGGLAAE